MISQEGPEVIKNIIRNSYDALVPGGVILIQEQFLDTDKSGPLLPALIGINQLIHTPAGRANSAKVVADWAAEIGFKNLRFRPLPEPSPFTLIQGTKAKTIMGFSMRALFVSMSVCALLTAPAIGAAADDALAAGHDIYQHNNIKNPGDDHRSRLTIIFRDNNKNKKKNNKQQKWND